MPETKGMITPPRGAANIAGNEQKRINGINEVFSLFGSRYDGIKMACKSGRCIMYRKWPP